MSNTFYRDFFIFLLTSVYKNTTVQCSVGLISNPYTTLVNELRINKCLGILFCAYVHSLISYLVNILNSTSAVNLQIWCYGLH